MKKIIFLLLGGSLAVNLWLLARSSEPQTEAASSAVKRAGATEHRSSTSVASHQTQMPGLVATLAQLDTSDPSVVRDRLRAAGADETTVFAVIDGIFRVRYFELWRVAELEHLKSAWWEGNAARAARAPSWNSTVMAPILDLLGPDPLDLADFASRYDFLPPEKARLLATIAIDYGLLQNRVSVQQGALPPSPQSIELLRAERRKDVMNTLTPEERAEYDLRFSDTAALNSRRFATMNVTEKEFRTIQPLVESLQAQLTALPRDQNQLAARTTLEQSTVDRLVDSVGYDRAIDYLWASTSGPYRSTANLLRELELPASNASRLLQLASETSAQAAAIHYDSQRSPQEKSTALLALQQSTQPQLNALIPPEAQAKLEPRAITWFKGTPIRPSLVGDGWTQSAPIAVTAPPRGSAPTIPLAKPSRL